MNTEKANTETEDSFFLPDLCAIQPVFLLILVSELFSIVLVLASSSLSAFNWEQLALVSLFVQWVALTSAAVLCQLRPFLRRLDQTKAVAISYLIIPFNTWIVSWISYQVLARVEFEPVGFFDDAILTNVLIAAIIGGLVIRYFYLQAQLIARKQSALVNRIQALQSRIRPHFLFNSMNIIASLISVDPETAEEVVEDLSHLFRASLNEVGNQVPFKDELNLCKRYLRIEQLRLGDRLQVHWDTRQVPDGLKIPMLTLQPLLENAILHGVQPLEDGGLIEIHGSYQHGVFELKIANPYTEQNQGTTTQRFQGNRIALENIRNRLNVLYGDRAKLTSYSENNLYITRLTYPYELREVAGTSSPVSDSAGTSKNNSNKQPKGRKRK
ncbi:MAG: sensor histidine kinase [Pseudomonadales bacterium]|nr:sensor histidine kinase [Pseudomonadales bacterium]